MSARIPWLGRVPALVCLLALALAHATGCGSDSSGKRSAPDGDGGAIGSGGSQASGGATTTGAGGATATGGTTAAGGATSQGGTAGSGSGGVATGGGAGAPDAGAPLPEAGTTDNGPAVDRTDPRLHEFTLDPKTVDPQAADYISDQFAQLDTRAAPLGLLVFFLPGANNTPSDWRNHGRKLAEFGFHVLIPHYDNAWGTACNGQPGSCNADTRWEALTGEDVSSVVDISRADSAEGRVLAMLGYLVTNDPGGDWGYYLNGDGTLRDDKVVMAGISHGATSAGLFGSRRAFHRVVMHSGGWGSVGSTPATPITEYYGLAHTGDPQFDAIVGSWESAGVPGAPTSLDGQGAPFGDSHRLITSATTTYPHCSVVVHSSSPTNPDGSYVFEPAWRYLYGAPNAPP